MSDRAERTLQESGHAPVNGIRMYYEVHGRAGGVPLVLLHGGGSTIEVTFGRALPTLARSRRVIAVEEQGHGRTTDRDAPFTFEASADDVAALLRQRLPGRSRRDPAGDPPSRADGRPDRGISRCYLTTAAPPREIPSQWPTS